jgi:folate-binding Fe-S cluster repair protein YgfZ
MPESSAEGFVCALTELGVIAATGSDAASFLHNQLTNEIQGLDTHHAHLAGYCSPKGRLLATLLVWKSEDTIYLALPKDVIASTLKRLQMFVLRSKVVLSDVSETMVMIGSAQMRALESPVWSLRISDAGSDRNDR